MVHAAIDAINRGDWDTALTEASPDFEYDLTRTDSPLRGVYGRGQMHRVLEDFLGSWQSVRYEPQELIECGDHVVMPFTTHFRGRQGIEMRAHATWVWTVREGALARLALFQDRDEALRFAGVPDDG